MPFALLIAEGTERGRRFRFAADSVAIGRGPENDVVLNDAAVSRAHARIERRGAAWVLLDRSSANGTQLNGAALAAAAALRDGDRIRVGAVTFEFRGHDCRALAAVAGRSRRRIRRGLLAERADQRGGAGRRAAAGPFASRHPRNGPGPGAARGGARRLRAGPPEAGGAPDRASQPVRRMAGVRRGEKPPRRR